MKKTVLRRYARLIARVGAGVQKGQTVRKGDLLVGGLIDTRLGYYAVHSEAEILALMDNETWYSAQQAVADGFVDRIMDAAQTTDNPMQLAASFGSGLLPPRVIDDAKAHLKKTAQARAEAEYNYLILEGKTK